MADNLGCSFGKVEGVGILVGTQVVDCEDKLLGEELWASEEYPADAGVDEAVFVATDVDAGYKRNLERVSYESGECRDEGRLR